MSSSKNLSISFNGPLLGLGTAMGYGYAGVQLIKSWQDQNVPVWWGREECPVAFTFGQPFYYEWQRDDQYKIGYTPWESTHIPYGWANRMNEMDEIWTTSEACKEWFILGGVKKKIRVLHHGINSDHFPVKKRTWWNDQTFKFLHIGEPAQRKGGELVYRAFEDCFGDDPRYHLTLKGNPTFKVELPNVTVVKRKLDQDELASLYHAHHAFVYPTNGEGFGLLPFQAAATGMPTLVTDWSGPVDYMQFCWPLHREKKLVKCDYDPHEGFWAQPNYESLKLWMEYVSDSPAYFFSQAHRRALLLHKNWQWETFATKSINWMLEKI
jgi:glycosyltransferase involved in cell wall biosynthesis